MYNPSDRKAMTHTGLNCFSPETHESHNYKLKLVNHAASTPREKKISTLITNTCGKNRK